MILYRDYNEEKRLDRVWYSSSNILYSECEDILNDFKILRVMFNNGSCYEYNDVDVNDYVMFVRGGLDGSNGSAFYKFIKCKYEYKKIESLKKEEVISELKEFLENSKVKENGD